jgi:16S rRNA (guanine527-N7)-methyltransferase
VGGSQGPYRGRALEPSDLREDEALALRLTPVSRETLDRLHRFVEMLLRWQRTLNLIAASTVPKVWTRHIADSLQLLPLAPEARTWVDFGAGGGFPGLVLGCALADAPGAVVHLVESNAKKVAFLGEAIRATGAAAHVHRCRVEDFVRQWAEPVDIVTARALTSLSELIEMAHPLLQNGAEALFLKGERVGEELTESAKYWNMAFTLLPSRSDPQGHIVRIHSACGLTPPA